MITAKMIIFFLYVGYESNRIFFLYVGYESNNEDVDQVDAVNGSDCEVLSEKLNSGED